jgi:hypothetical protein
MAVWRFFGLRETITLGSRTALNLYPSSAQSIESNTAIYEMTSSLKFAVVNLHS